ncbi:MAG TPA: MMPL family transporter [Mycobacteriales bacterium]|nr:MMPL family transporter [Mycobacteriales bacterium]
MLARIGGFAARRHRLVLIAAVLLFLAAGILGAGVAERLSLGGFEDKGAESTRARELLDERFGGQPNLVLLVEPTTGDVDDPAVAAAGRALTAELGKEVGVGGVASYWTLGNAPPLRSKTGDSALVLAVIEGGDDVVADVAEQLVPRYTREDGAVISVRPGGIAAVFDEVGKTIEKDAVRAELVALPITLILLVLIFGSVVAATLPLAIGLLSIVGTFVVLRVVASFTEVSLYSLNLTTAMGLGLGIDYSLFMVSRYREELRGGATPYDAVVRTVRTAGRTVTFSALTVAVSLGALLVFPLSFLRSFAYAGIAVVAVAGIASVVVLPALLAALGPRIEKWVLWRHTPAVEGQGMWHRIAVFVMRRPLPVAVAVTALLLFLGSPFLGLRLGLPDDRSLPEDAASRQVSEQIRSDYTSRESAALSVVLPDLDATTSAAPIGAYAERLSAIDGVARVDATTGSYINGTRVFPATPASARFRGAAGGGTYLSVIPDVEPLSAAGEQLTADVRAALSPVGAALVAGPGAELVDTKASITSRLPLAGLLIALSTFVVLFLSFGSLLVPAKAVVLNLLSLTATFGAMVWIFQDGHLSGLLDVTATGSLTATMPVLMFCIAFGLSMDYEVFLLSRIKEEHDRSGDNTRSVALGLERTGRIVTAAALLISVIFAAFALTSGVSFMKLFGVGLTMAVILDATLIRAALVPAFMKLAGEANWWAPTPLRRFYDRFGIAEHEVLPDPAREPVELASR